MRSMYFAYLVDGFLRCWSCLFLQRRLCNKTIEVWAKVWNLGALWDELVKCVDGGVSWQNARSTIWGLASDPEPELLPPGISMNDWFKLFWFKLLSLYCLSFWWAASSSFETDLCLLNLWNFNGILFGLTWSSQYHCELGILIR